VTSGHCPAGVQHDASDSGNYRMFFGTGLQANLSLFLNDGIWLWCAVCEGMFLRAVGIHGTCPRGAVFGAKHSPTGSGIYAPFSPGPMAL
jgi:hypothetical protein